MVRPLIVALNCRSGIGRPKFGCERSRIGARTPSRIDQASKHESAHHLATVVLPRARGDKRDWHAGCLLKPLHVDWPIAKKRLNFLKANGLRPYAGNGQ